MTDLQNCPFCGADNAMMLPPTCRPETPYNAADRLFPIVRCGSCCAEVSGSNEDYRGHSAIAAWNRRASPSPAGGVQGVKVKALEWREYSEPTYTAHDALSIVGGYSVYQFPPQQLVRLGTPDGRSERVFNTIAEAKAAAQSDYEQRILSVLSSQAQTTGGVRDAVIEECAAALDGKAAASPTFTRERLIKYCAGVVRALKSGAPDAE